MSIVAREQKKAVIRAYERAIEDKDMKRATRIFLANIDLDWEPVFTRIKMKYAPR